MMRTVRAVLFIPAWSQVFAEPGTGIVPPPVRRFPGISSPNSPDQHESTDERNYARAVGASRIPARGATQRGTAACKSAVLFFALVADSIPGVNECNALPSQRVCENRDGCEFGLRPLFRFFRSHLGLA